MKTQLKTFEFHVQFDSVSVVIKAKHSREAKSKLIQKLAKFPAKRFLDKHNLFVNEIKK